MTLNSMPRLLSLSINFVLEKAAPGVKTPPLEDNNETNMHKAVSSLPSAEPVEWLLRAGYPITAQLTKTCPGLWARVGSFLNPANEQAAITQEEAGAQHCADAATIACSPTLCSGAHPGPPTGNHPFIDSPPTRRINKDLSGINLGNQCLIKHKEDWNRMKKSFLKCNGQM